MVEMISFAFHRMVGLIYQMLYLTQFGKKLRKINPVEQDVDSENFVLIYYCKFTAC